MSAAALLYITVSMSHEVVASNLDPADILKWHVEKAVRGIPDRVYAVDRRVVRCVALPPWELWDVRQGGSHVDPLAMDLYSIRLYSRNLESGSHEERLYAQSIIKNIPEGAMFPEGFAAYFSNMPGNRYDSGRNQATLAIQNAHHDVQRRMDRAKLAQQLLDTRLISRERAAKVLGEDAKKAMDDLFARLIERKP